MPKYPNRERILELMEAQVEHWYAREYRDPRDWFNEQNFLTELEEFPVGDYDIRDFYRYVHFHFTYWKRVYADLLAKKGYEATRRWADGAVQRRFMRPEELPAPAVSQEGNAIT